MQTYVLQSCQRAVGPLQQRGQRTSLERLESNCAGYLTQPSACPSALLRLRSQCSSRLHGPSYRRSNTAVQAQKISSSSGQQGGTLGSSDKVANSPPEESGDTSSSDKQALFGQLALLGTALLWGTNAPANRFLYLQGEGQAPTPSLITAVQTTGAVVCLFLIDAVSKQLNKQSGSDGSSSSASSSVGGDAAASDSAPKSWPASLLAATGTNVYAAGFEIGFWAVIAQTLTVTGFANTTTSRGAFLVRLSAVFTPIVAATFGDKVAIPVWLGSLAALVGGLFIGIDGSDGASGGGLNLASGDILIIIAALVWSIQTVRVGKVAPNFRPLQLAKLQLATMSLLSTAWFAKDAIATASQGSSLDSLWGGHTQLLNWGVLLIPAVGPWSVGVALQLKGQSSVPASVAMLIFATDPVWAILYAGLLGGNEQHLGTFGVIGAACILSASIIASFGKKKS